MRCKICAKCNCANGSRAAYCRKCWASLDDARIEEIGQAPKEAKPTFRSAPKASAEAANRASRPASRRPSQPKEEAIVLPKRPAKPNVVYWPFIASMVSALGMLILIVAFVISSAASSGSPAPSGNSAGNSANNSTSATAATTVASTEATEASPIDISEVQIGDVPDQSYTGDFVTVPFSLILNDNILEEGVDYTVTYEDNIAVGTATANFEGNGTTYVGSFSASFNIVSGDPVCDDPSNSGIVIAVMRLSWGMLGRSPSASELIDQVGRLKSGEISGSGLMNEIIFSDECINRGLSDADFVSSFYVGVLGREADPAGLEYNVGLLAGGMSRQDLVNGIMAAPGGEFEAICNSIGIATV
ncbi:MAG: DUF4214 domain-containing protein [Clostridiales bacterium]|nr:DUF4214 domain-containing protein [Clostridiales bacterium]